MTKAAVLHITDTLGSDAIQRELGVGFHSVRRARTEGAFPASWFDQLEVMCSAAGIECPRSAFNFKAKADAP